MIMKRSVSEPKPLWPESNFSAKLSGKTRAEPYEIKTAVLNLFKYKTCQEGIILNHFTFTLLNS